MFAHGTHGVHTLSLRTKILLTCILLVISLFSLCFATKVTIGAFDSFQRQNTLTNEGNVSTIRPWMTIPYVARVYHVPESYLYTSLHITNTRPLRHATLTTLATRDRRPVQELIRQVQQSVLAYRRYRQKYPHTHIDAYREEPLQAIGRV